MMGWIFLAGLVTGAVFMALMIWEIQGGDDEK